MIVGVRLATILRPRHFPLVDYHKSSCELAIGANSEFYTHKKKEKKKLAE